MSSDSDDFDQASSADEEQDYQYQDSEDFDKGVMDIKSKIREKFSAYVQRKVIKGDYESDYDSGTS